MKGIVRLSIIFTLCIGLVFSEAGTKDEQTKQVSNNLNAIGSTVKPDLLSYQQITQQYSNKYQPQQTVYQQQYQPRTQLLHQAVPYNHQPEAIRRPQHQSTPVAMVIIAQPAYVPASMLQQGNVANQLLHYFQGGNAQVRYQFIPSNHQQFHKPLHPTQLQTQQISHFINYQPQQEARHYQQPATAAPIAPAQASQSSFFNHEALPTPEALVSQQHHIVPHHLSQPTNNPTGSYLPNQFSQQSIDYQPQQLQQAEQQSDHQNPEITRLAQQAAQHFFSNGALNSGSRTAPAIITGLEHFSPEQQEKIKKQLSAHFGSPLKPLNFDGTPRTHSQETPLSNGKYYEEQRHRIKNERFVPSIEVKDGEIRQTSPSGGGKM